jgi:hypothetical protein
MDKTVWQSVLTESMTNALSDDELKSLIEELNDAVMFVCADYGIS